MRDRLVLIDGPYRLPNRRDNRLRLDRCTNHDAARPVPGLVRLFVHTIDRGLQFLRHAAFAYFLYYADYRVPVSLAAPTFELESRAQRRTSRKIAIRKGFVDDGHRRF